MWSTPNLIKLSKFFCPMLVLEGVFQVTARGLHPYSKHFIICQVLSLPPLTGTTQS